MRFSIDRRITLLFFVLLVCMGVLAVRLGFIQIKHGHELSQQAMARNTQMLALEDFQRGEILDCNGESLTGSYSTNRIVVFPTLVEDTEDAVQRLGQILGRESSFLRPFFEGEPAYLPVNITQRQASMIREQTGTGIAVLPVKKRYGPDPLAVHFTGRLGKINSMEVYEKLNLQGQKNYNLDDWVGVSGLEKYYEDYLKGSFPERQAYVPVDARERPVTGSFRRKDMVDMERNDVVTTISKDVQQVVEEEMDKRIDKGAVVIMKAGSGDILATASRPDFNPDLTQLTSSGAGEDGKYINRAVSFFQPGSLFKVVLAGAVLEEGIAGPTSSFSCEGENDEPVRCWHPSGHGEITLYEAMVNSCNPSFVQLGEKLGAALVVEYAEKLGLAEREITGFSGSNSARQDWSVLFDTGNLANSSVGQGPVMVTPVQVTALMNAIASGGHYYKPRLVSEVYSESGSINYSSSSPEKVLSSTTVNELRSMLEGVTATGVGQQAFSEKYRTAGKTGSAQVKDYRGEYINAWFSGYVPAEEPEYVITVLVQNGESGGETAAPVFKSIAEKIMRYH